MIVNRFCFRAGIDGVIAKELSQSLYLFDPAVVGEESVVTDAVEATGQDMQEKTPNELVNRQRHGFVTIRPFGTIVLPLEGDTAFIAGHEPAVADGDPMGVASEVSEHGFGSGERSLGIDHPVDGAQWRQIVGEVLGLSEVLVRAEELQMTSVVRGAELFQEQTPKQP